jgi:hypothetical protein
MKYIILVTTLFFSGLMCLPLAYAQSGSASFSDIINKSGKYKDTIIKHEWNPTNIPDSLLFNGIQKFTFPKTNVSITPPKTFRADNQGNLIHDWTGSSIQCTIVNANYLSLLKTINKETFEKQGYTYINQQTLSTRTNKEGTLFLIGFTSNGMEYERIVFFIGNNNQTAWLSINYPVMMKSLIFETIENCLTTIEF